MESDSAADNMLDTAATNIASTSDANTTAANTTADEGSNSFSKIPDDVTTNILLRLPVKSMLQCKYVQTLWLRLVSSPPFPNLNNFSDCFLILGTYAYPRRFFTCSFPSLFRRNPRVVPLHFSDINPISRVVGTCNGLICGSMEEEGSLTLSNPTTKKFKTLTVQIEDDVKPLSYGFCYDNLNDDYKVVMLSSPLINGSFVFETRAKVYSLRDDSWNEIDYFDGGCPSYACGIFVSGRLHFSGLNNDGRPPFILSLHMVNYVFGIVDLPRCDGMDEDHGEWTLADFDGCLGLICDYDEMRVDFWVMREYGVNESWVKLRSIHYPLNLDDVMSPILRSGNGDIILNYYPHFLEYNSGNDLFSRFEIDGSDLYVCGPPSTKSLVPLTYLQ